MKKVWRSDDVCACCRIVLEDGMCSPWVAAHVASVLGDGEGVSMDVVPPGCPYLLEHILESEK